MRYYCLLAILLVVSCQKPVLPVSTQKTADMQVPELYDPYELPNILGTNGAYLEAKFAGAMSEVPKVEINLRDGVTGNYEIQRCPKGVKLETAIGIDPVTHNYHQDTEAQQKDYLYVWGMAAAGACTLLGSKHVSTPFVDDFNTETIGGTNGFNFFYLVRPCLLPSDSIYRDRRTCSYAFARTNSIEGYVNNVAEENRGLTADLAAQRSRLEHRMMQMASVIRQKAHYLKKCAFNDANSKAMHSRLAGIAKVALTVGGVIVGTLITGGTAIFLAASAAAQLGDKLFSGISNATLNCPTGVYDEKNKDILADVKKTIDKIGKIRTSLGELDLAGKAAPPPEEAMEKIAGEECAQEGLGKNCMGT